MIEQNSLKRITLRAALRHVSPMVIRLISVSDRIDLSDFNDIFCAVLGWSGQMGYILRVHGQECNSFRRKTRAKVLHEFKLHRQEKFLYVCDTLHRWEWDVQVLDIEGGIEKDTPVCLGGRGATPILMLAEACPDQPPQTWDLLRIAMDDGLRSIDLRLKESGPLEPERFSLQEANERLRIFTQQRRGFWLDRKSTRL